MRLTAKKNRRLRTATLGLLLIAGGCGGGGGGENPGPPPPPQPTITSVTVSPASATLEIGLTQQFTATVQGTGSFNSAASWFVNNIAGGNSTVGTISSAGLYTAPDSVPSPAGVTVKAVSVQDSSKSSTASVTITTVQQVSLEWVKFIDFGNTQSDDGFGVAIDSQDNIIAGGFKWLRYWEDPVGSGVPDPFGALVSLDKLGNERWRAIVSNTGSQVFGIVREGVQDRFYFTGRALLPSYSSLMSAFLGQVNTGGQVLIDPLAKLFQINSNESMGRLIQMQGSQLFITVNTPADPYVAMADLSGNIQQSFQVGKVPATTQRGPISVCDTCNVTGMWVASDHLWVTGERTVANRRVGYYLERFTLGALDGNVVVTTGSDVLGTRVVEDLQGSVFLGGTFQSTSGANNRLFLVQKMDQQGNVVWAKNWDGDNSNTFPFLFGLTPRPNGGVVAFGYLTEFLGANQFCTTYPNCWDFGLWALNADGTDAWKLRRDFNKSPWDFPRAAIFDSQNRLIVVGSTAPNPTGNDFTDNVDMLIAKFRVP